MYSYEDANERSHAKLHGVSFFLQWISSWISRTEDLNLGSLYLHILPLTLRLCQDTIYADTSSRGNRFQELITQFIYIHNDLNIINCRTVIQGDKIHLFATTAVRTHPFTFTVVPKASLFSTSTIFVRLIVSICIVFCYSKAPILRAFTSLSFK